MPLPAIVYPTTSNNKIDPNMKILPFRALGKICCSSAVLMFWVLFGARCRARLLLFLNLSLFSSKICDNSTLHTNEQNNIVNAESFNIILTYWFKVKFSVLFWIFSSFWILMVRQCFFYWYTIGIDLLLCNWPILTDAFWMNSVQTSTDKHKNAISTNFPFSVL